MGVAGRGEDWEGRKASEGLVVEVDGRDKRSGLLVTSR